MNTINSNSPGTIIQDTQHGKRYGNWEWDAIHQVLIITTPSGSKYDFSPFRPRATIQEFIRGFADKRWLSAVDLLDLESALRDIGLE